MSGAVVSCTAGKSEGVLHFAVARVYTQSGDTHMAGGKQAGRLMMGPD